MTFLERKCVKCESKGKLHRHHITYSPPLMADLCPLCHSRVTGLNTKGSFVAWGNKKTRPDYTNRLRLVLWNWFLKTPWPDRRRVSQTEVRDILSKARFQIISLRGRHASPCSRPGEHSGKPHPTSQRFEPRGVVCSQPGHKTQRNGQQGYLKKTGLDQIRMIQSDLLRHLQQALG